MANISRISAGQYGSALSQDQHGARQNLGHDVFERIETIRCSTATTTSRQIFSSQNGQMFGDTRQAMGLHLRSTSHGGHGYLRGGGSVTSVPLTHHSALWLAGLGGGISYYIMPPSYIHSSVALLSYSTSPILVSHLCWS